MSVAVDQSLKLKTYDALAFLRLGQVDLALRHVSKPSDTVQLGDVAVSLHHQLQPKVTLAGKATYSHASKEVSGQAAVRVQLSDRRAYAVRAQCSGTLAL